MKKEIKIGIIVGIVVIIIIVVSVVLIKRPKIKDTVNLPPGVEEKDGEKVGEEDVEVDFLAYSASEVDLAVEKLAELSDEDVVSKGLEITPDYWQFVEEIGSALDLINSLEDQDLADLHLI